MGYINKICDCGQVSARNYSYTVKYNQFYGENEQKRGVFERPKGPKIAKKSSLKDSNSRKMCLFHKEKLRSCECCPTY